MALLKPFALKLLYFVIGLLPLAVLLFIAQQDLENNPANLLWFGLFGAMLIASIMVQKKLRKMGVLNMKEIGTYVALFLVAGLFFLIVRQIYH